MTETEQLIENEVRRLERAVDVRRKMLARAKGPRRSQPRRYVVDITMDTSADTTLYVPQTSSVIVDKTAIAFYCEEIVGSLAFIGTVDDGADGVPGKVSTSVIAGGIGFDWEVRDTYSDRSWQSAKMPGEILASMRDSGFRLARPCPLPGGTEISATIIPWNLSAALGMFSSIDQVSFQLAFVGYEVLP